MWKVKVLRHRPCLSRWLMARHHSPRRPSDRCSRRNHFSALPPGTPAAESWAQRREWSGVEGGGAVERLPLLSIPPHRWTRAKKEAHSGCTVYMTNGVRPFGLRAPGDRADPRPADWAVSSSLPFSSHDRLGSEAAVWIPACDP